jgi:hypothetical protein
MPEHAPSTVVAHYLSALAASDLERARGLLADDFTFRGPGMARAVDRETFIAEFGAKYDHVSDLRLLRQTERDGQVASLYELHARTPHGATTFLMSEWNTVRDGRLESALLVFDTAAGARLHAGGHASDNPVEATRRGVARRRCP